MIYADYNGTAPMIDEVKTYLLDRIENGPYANPNAIHCIGTQVLNGMEKCRSICAEAVGAKPNQVIFTSGASESISTIFHSLFSEGFVGNKNIIISSPIEHSATANALEFYKEKGAKVHFLPVNKDGVVEMDIFKKWVSDFKDRIALVVTMAANNETGVIQPFEEMGFICEQDNLPFFSDTTQLIGKSNFHFKNSLIDYACLSGHKIGSLTGVGILLAKTPTTIKPLIFGGGQEKGLRGGTQNYIGNETLAVALSHCEKDLDNLVNLENERINFETKLKSSFPEIVIIGENSKRLPSTTLVSNPGIHGQAVQIELESHDIFVTTSSACSDNDPATSKVLKAMNIDDRVGRGVVRISLGTSDHPEDIYQRIFEVLSRVYDKLGDIKSY